VQTCLPDVDAAWPKLEASIREVCDLMGHSPRLEELDDAFRDLVDLLIAIFRREEEAMASASDPRGTIHRQGHLGILSQLAQLRADAREAGPSPSLSQRMRTTFLDAVREHHVVLDALLGRHMQNWIRERDDEDDDD
jgi:hemerythrin